MLCTWGKVYSVCSRPKDQAPLSKSGGHLESKLDFKSWVNISERARNERDFPWAKPKVNYEEHPCQPEENPVRPHYITWTLIVLTL